MKYKSVSKHFKTLHYNQSFKMSKKQKLNLIEELTTHKNDYQKWALKSLEARTTSRPREEPVAKPQPQSVHLDPQSHAPYKPSVHVPFDLYLLPKPIVGKDPREYFNIQKSQKFRSNRENLYPPIVLSPTLPLGEIQDDENLHVILNYTYTGMHKILLEEAALKSSKQPKPFSRVEIEGSDLRFKPVIYAPLPPGWVTASKHWDCLQSRNLGNPFKSFWTLRGPEVECSCCCNPLPDMLPQETKEEIEKLICEDNLRLPYDITKIGYKGYRQICAKGVSLEKNKAKI